METPIDEDVITPDQGSKALRVALEMAWQNEQWHLVKSVLKYIKDAGGCIQRHGPLDFLIQYPKE